ncbi:type II secretion system protein [Campylobacter sp. faydin G-24]|uniref:Type II secretion system protein n=1 Tax=Campylobacter anatolicus TaxID=2829105 RepID=A0ABS5HJZ6_9BACT|nr:type II secretion system protein [Campylobacter anatolicus]MBR8464386.1 type II secretion system protein [Campylobacter anatolicus]
MRSAFSMVEIILVIVLVGIIGISSFEIVNVIFQNYAQSRTINLLQNQTELTLEMIAKRLSYRIKDSVIARSENGDFKLLNSQNINKDHKILEFIAYSHDAFNAGVYSGFADLVASDSKNGLKTPLSNLTLGKEIFSDLSNKTVNFSDVNGGVIAIFGGIAYNESSFGYDGLPAKDIAKVAIQNSTTLKISDDFSGKISEQYHLAHSAYALVPQNDSGDKFDLLLYYNYRPWHRQNYKNGESSILAQNLTQFSFSEQNGAIIIKICLKDGELVVCKSKAVT